MSAVSMGSGPREAILDHNASIARLLETRAAHTPDAVAIVAPGRAPLTYRQLWKHVDEIVAALHGNEIGREGRVAIVLPNGPEMAVTALAVACGATAAPLNPAYRASEFAECLSTNRARALIVQSGVDSPARTVARARGIRIIELSPVRDGEAGLFALQGADRPVPARNGFARSGDVALLLQTTGTTGTPKMVALTHENICVSAYHTATTLALGPDDRCLNVMALFHVHGLVGALLSSLAGGGSVACLFGFDAPRFFGWLEAFHPTWYTAVPAMHQAILARADAHREIIARCPLRFIRSCSAPLPRSVMAELERTFNVPVIEAYGMTEAAHQITSNPLPPGRQKPGSVGVAVGPAVAVVDEGGRELLPNEAGDIVIRGETVAKGYDEDDLANQRAFADGWFRTGDLGFKDEDGYLYITGRRKEIINRGGEKIAPCEVDEALMAHPAVAEAAAFAVPSSTLGEEVGAAVVVRGQAPVTARELQEFAAIRLADWKVPRQVVIVDEIPKSATGKVRRLALAEKLGVRESEAPSPVMPDFTAPRTPLEATLCRIWAEVLGVERVGVYDNFFALGGDSILAAQLLLRIRQAVHADISILTLFEALTVAALAQSVERAMQDRETVPREPIQRVCGDGEAPLSFAQQRLWFLDQLESGDYAYNRPTHLRLTGRLNVSALEASLTEITRRHDVLRATFLDVDGTPVQRIGPVQRLTLPVVDLSDRSEAEREADALRLVTEETRRPFDLAQGPLVRTALLRLREEEHILLVTIHHIVFDGWSEGIWLRELADLYAAFANGERSPLPDLPIQYGDFAAWQRQWLRGEILDAKLAYWRKALEGLPPRLELPSDDRRPLGDLTRTALRPLTIPPPLTEALKTLSRREEVSLFMTLLASFQLLLHRYIGQDDIPLGTFAANRDQMETADLIGFFVNNLVLRTDLSGDPTVRELLGRVRAVTLGAYAHQDLPFETLLAEVHPQRNLGQTPLFQVMLVLHNFPASAVWPPGLTVAPYRVEIGRSSFALTLWLREQAGELTGFLEYQTARFEARTIDRMLSEFRALLEHVAVDPEQRISALRVRTGPEPPEPPDILLGHGPGDITGERPSVLDEVRPASTADGDEPARRARLQERLTSLSPAKRALLERRVHGSPTGSRVQVGLEHSVPDVPATPALAPPDGEHVRAPETFPLSFAQQHLWILDQLQPGSAAYNMAGTVRLSGALDLTALERSLEEIVRRHDTLRTTFAAVDGQPVQVIAPPAPLTLPLVDLEHLRDGERQAEADRLAAEEAKRPFDLARGPLFRLTLLRLAAEAHVLVVAMHHIVSDEWSLRVFLRELRLLYDALSKGQFIVVPELPLRYAEFARRQRELPLGAVPAAELDYWKRQLGGELSVLDLPTDRPRSPVQTFRGARQSVALGETLTAALRALSDREGATLFMTLLAAFKTLLHRWTGQTDIVVCSLIAGRNRKDLEGLIGCFLNTLVLRTSLGGDPSFSELLARVSEVTVGAYEHQELPFEKLLEELRPERDSSRSPLFQVCFNMMNLPDARVELPGLSIDGFESAESWSKFDLTAYVKERGNGLHVDVVYNADLFEAATVERLMEHFKVLVEGIVANPDDLLSRVSLVRQSDRRRQVSRQPRPRLAGTFVEFPGEALDGSIPRRFEQQVAQYPRHVAVRTRWKTWTYDALNRAANRVAHTLLEHGGVGAERVGLLLGHDGGMLAGILGTLKAGKTYVPLDPNDPRDRLTSILGDADVGALVTETQHRAYAESLASSRIPLIPLEAAERHRRDDNPGLLVAPDTLAYLLYTSGSTGPKGVMHNHRNVLHFIRVYTNNLRISAADRLTLFAPYSFDVAVMDIFGALLNGAALYAWDLREEGLLALTRWLVEQKITIFHSTPTLYRHYVSGLMERDEFPAMRAVVLCGENVYRQDVELFRKRFPRECVLVNGLGPTESPMTLQHFVDSETEITRTRVPVGYPVEETDILLLDEAGTDVGLYGEIAIRSPYVALGYWRHPELTGAMFRTDPDHQNLRIYRTGDLGRLLPDGAVEFVGRRDSQVRLGGVRIELAEIETVLSQHSGVRETAVVLRDDPPGHRRLVAYWVAAEPPGPSAGELRRLLTQKLPKHMVPSAFVRLEALPLLPTGKVDRRALPAERESAFVAPRSSNEKVMAGIWAEVLGIEALGIHDNFFDLGGHSLLATRLISRVRAAFQVNLPVRSLFEAPTLASLTELVEARQWAARETTTGQGLPDGNREEIEL